MSASTLPDPFPPGVDPPWTVEGHADPVPWGITMASERPVAIDPDTGCWHFCGYPDVLEFVKDTTWSVAKRLEQLPPEQRFVRLLTTDPPVHSDVRKHFARAYRPRRIEVLEAQIRAVCRELVEQCIERRRFDVVADLAAPLTATMIGQLLGVPSEDRERFNVLSLTGGQSLGQLSGPGDRRMPPMNLGGGLPRSVIDAQAEYFAELIAVRRAEPCDDLISDLARVPAEDLELKFDVSTLLREQLGAGQNTTTHLLGSLVYLLDTHPDQRALLRERPDLVASAIEETARVVSPVQARPRISVGPIRVRGIDIPEGTTGVAWLHAANHDPAQFPDPARYDIARSPNHHLAFGIGEHYCLGASLARAEARVAVEELLSATQSIARVDSGPPEWIEDFVMRGPARMEVEVVPA